MNEVVVPSGIYGIKAYWDEINTGSPRKWPLAWLPDACRDDRWQLPNFLQGKPLWLSDYPSITKLIIHGLHRFSRI
ncbi:hypothetical protein KA005_65150, partial [bacterium]|nr:hypothetical protein [bacterium]